jgi:hypothetical protein
MQPVERFESSCSKRSNPIKVTTGIAAQNFVQFIKQRS